MSWRWSLDQRYWHFQLVAAGTWAGSLHLRPPFAPPQAELVLRAVVGSLFQRSLFQQALRYDYDFIDGERVRHGPIPLSTAHWALFLSIEQCRSLVDRIRNDRCAFVGETAVPQAAVCRGHNSGAELPVRAGQTWFMVCLPMNAPDDRCRMNKAVGTPRTSDRRH